MNLLPFQQRGVETAEGLLDGRGGVLIADEMGLGKTIQAIALLERRSAYPALIVCPASLKINWQREFQRWASGRTVTIGEGRRPRSTRNPADVTIINYEILNDWLPVLSAVNAVILDESHSIKNGSAIRTRAAIKLSDSLPPETLRICLSGTPIVNNPTELIPQLRFLHRIEDFGGIHAFRQRYGTGERLTELNLRLRACCLIRRRKADVLQELPERTWIDVIVAGDARVMTEYRDAESDIINYLADTDLTAATVAGRAQQLVKLHHLRRLATEAKMPAVIDWIEAFPATERKLVIFAHHRHIVYAFAERFSGNCAIHGGQTGEERQANVDRFQNDPAQRVIVCSLRAAGVGLTLTSASDVLFVEQGWTSAEMDQAIDRCHRIGQHDPVTAWNLLCADTVDERVNSLIRAKRDLVTATTDGYMTGRETVTADLLRSYGSSN